MNLEGIVIAVAKWTTGYSFSIECGGGILGGFEVFHCLGSNS